MSRFAKLTSIDAVREMAAALRAFGEEVAAALDGLDMSVRRATEWIHHDRKEYWAHEVRRGHEHVGEAQAELEKALTYRGMSGQPPSCRQERALLEKAKLRVRTAEEKTEAVRHWTHVIEHAVIELSAGQAPMADWLVGELPKALAALDQMTAALESYAEATQSADGPTSATSTAPADPTAPRSQDDANLGPQHAAGKTPSGDEGLQSG